MPRHLLTASAACALLWATPAPAYNLGAATPAQFSAALAKARPGDVVQLGPTFNGPVAISGVKAGGVTIRSQSDHIPAVITSLKVTGSSGLNFGPFEVAFPAALAQNTAVYGAKVTNSKDIHFRNIDMHGVVDGDPSNDIGGLQISASSNVTVDASELHDLRNGIGLQGDHITITGSHFHDIRIDGIDGVASDHVLIDSNRFENFHHLGSASAGGDHSDAIQFFTQNQPRASSNLVIKRNAIVQGNGAVMQGIFIQDEANVGPYVNVEIDGNTIVGGNWNGIAVSHAQNLKVTNNTVAAIPGQVATPWIRVQTSPGAVQTGNTTPKVTDGGKALLSAWTASK